MEPSEAPDMGLCLVVGPVRGLKRGKTTGRHENFFHTLIIAYRTRVCIVTKQLNFFDIFVQTGRVCWANFDRMHSYAASFLGKSAPAPLRPSVTKTGKIV